MFNLSELLKKVQKIQKWACTCLIPNGDSNDSNEKNEDLPGNLRHKNDYTQKLD